MNAVPVLASFHFWKRVDMTALIDQHGGAPVVDLFADSGAFSAASSGVPIDVLDYAAWLRKHAGVINFAAGLDVIGDAKESAKNTNILEDEVGDVVKIVPTFHVGSDWKELEAMAKTHDFISLGGAVPYSSREAALTSWLAKAHKILAETGTVAHGFGLTRHPYPVLFPWYSVDSSYWTLASRTGGFWAFDSARGKFVRLVTGRRLTAEQVKIVREYGGDPKAFTRKGFGLVGRTADKDQARAENRWLRLASASTWYRYQDYWRRLARPVDMPARVRHAGPKVYLAIGGREDLGLAIRAASHGISTAS